MKKEFNFENTTPMEIFKKFPEFRKNILDLQILRLRNKKTGKDLNLENLKDLKKEDIELVIPSFKCIRKEAEKEKRASLWFPFFHQVFWFLLMELKDVKFAISELKIVSNNGFQFPNGVFVELDRRKEFNF